MREMLARLMTPLLLYAAFLADVTLHSVSELRWRPSLLLLAAFIIVRTPAGIVWSAAAGLICDGIADRPLGATMLAATLTATICRDVTRENADSAGWFLVKAFLFVTAIECSSGVIAETVSASPDAIEATASGLQTGIATTVVAAVLAVFRRLTRRSSRPRAVAASGRWDLGGTR